MTKLHDYYVGVVSEHSLNTPTCSDVMYIVKIKFNFP